MQRFDVDTVIYLKTSCWLPCLEPILRPALDEICNGVLQNIKINSLGVFEKTKHSHCQQNLLSTQPIKSRPLHS